MLSAANILILYFTLFTTTNAEYATPATVQTRVSAKHYLHRGNDRGSENRIQVKPVHRPEVTHEVKENGLMTPKRIRV